MVVAAYKGYRVCLHPLRPLLSANSLHSLLTPHTHFETQGDGRAESDYALPASPFHKPGLAEELSQILADSCTGGAHHEVQDHLEMKKGQETGVSRTAEAHRGLLLTSLQEREHRGGQLLSSQW